MRIGGKNRAQVRHDIIYLPVGEISPNPVQPRRGFDQSGLEELSESIREYGILNPLTVRLRGGRYELIAGERRLRAAKMAGLTEVPCLALEVNMEQSGLIALVENLQRRDLNFVEEAEGISQLVRLFGMSQEEAARRLGKSQSAVANKLRLLKLPRDVLSGLLENGLTERHGRALLRLETPDAQRRALEEFVSREMTVAAADAYVDALLADEPEEEEAEPRRTGRTRYILKDVRLFLNTLSRSLDMMKQSGISAGMDKQETEDRLILTISIPKRRGG